MTRAKFERRHYGRFIDPGFAAAMAAAVLADPPPRRDVVKPGVHEAHLRVGDADYVRKVTPKLADDRFVELIRLAAEAAAGHPVVTSPWPRSALSLIVYGAGDWIGPHYDTNSISAVLTLSCADPVNSTRILTRRKVTLEAGGGDLVIFDGKNLLHGTAPYPDDQTPRVTLVTNLYLEGDVNPDMALDDLIYG